MEEEGVLPQPAGVQVVVHLGDITRLPEVHQTVNLVDERSGVPLGVKAHRLPFPLMPRTQLDDAACALLGFGVGIGLFVAIVHLVVIVR